MSKIELDNLHLIFDGNIPNDYLKILQSSNGGDLDVSNCLFKYRKNNGRYSAWAISKNLSVEEIARAIESMDGMLDRCFVPVATVSNGDPIVISKKLNEHGSIYLYDGDEMNADNVPKTKLHDSFSGFIKSLTYIDELDTIVKNGISCN